MAPSAPRPDHEEQLVGGCLSAGKQENRAWSILRHSKGATKIATVLMHPGRD